MRQTIETNKIVVIHVSERGCTCAVNGANRDITWEELDDAASQADNDLADVYKAVRTQARKIVEGNRSLPLSCSVHQDETRVWWVARFTDVAGEWHWIPRAADQGGTLAHERMARQEGKDRAMQLRAMGYIVRGC